MFFVYHSNQLDLLKTLTAELLKRDSSESIFDHETILVQSQGMGQWLQIQLAKELGIAANIKFPFPNQFMWDIYQTVLPDFIKESVYDVDLVMWKLLAMLPDVIHQDDFATLQTYLADDKHDKKHYQLALNIAGLFDQYLVYRPDWIDAWSKGETIDGLYSPQIWQAKLWQQLSKKNHENPFWHRAEIHNTVIERLNSGSFPKETLTGLPKRIFIFGIVSLPPNYLALLHALSRYIDIHFMFMNPCRLYWGDIIDQRAISHQIKQQQNKITQNSSVNDYAQGLKIHAQTMNPLLASWGKQGRDNLLLLQNFDDRKEIDAFVDYDTSSLLGSVQQAILDLHNPMVIGKEHDDFITSQHKQTLSLTDHSITIQSCHSEQREVELLYDHLLALFDSDPSLTLRDCVVMVADIDHYAPYIQAVFDNAPYHRRLPYSIADRKLRHIDSIIQGFFLILDLPHSRFELEYIFDLLAIPAVATHFNINDKQLKQLQHWVVEAGIRWGASADSKMPHDWLSGLNRMLLGYVMDSHAGSWQGVLPYDGALGLEAETIGLLSEFVQTLIKWREQLSEQKPIIDWKPICLALLRDFFAINNDSEPELLLIDEQWQKIITKAQQANYTLPLGITLLQSEMQAKLDNHYLSHHFLVGRINFCTMMPMRSIPFKIVCLLGMNDGIYPRPTMPLGFDLIAKHARQGDRSRRHDDRYLFLEALLSAEQQLYISYIGRDMKTNSLRYPSILVDELIDYIAQCYVLVGDEQLNLDESNEKIKQFLCTQHTRTPFNPDNFLLDSSKNLTRNSVKSYADEWLPSARRQGAYQPFITPIAPVIYQTIKINELKQFYRHSIRAFINQRLHYRLYDLDDNLPDSENFNLNPLQRFHINQSILDTLLDSNSNQQVDNLYEQMIQSSQLPYGSFGQLAFTKQLALMQDLIVRINTERLPENWSKEVNLTISDYHLQGYIEHIQADGILHWQPKIVGVYDGFALWIDHLLYCAMEPQAENHSSRLYGRDNSQWLLTYINKVQAIDILNILIDGYQQGMNQPLFMPLKSTWAWLETGYDKQTQQLSEDSEIYRKGKNNFLTSWQNDFSLQSECDDYYLRLYPELTHDLLEQAFDNGKRYLLPFLQCWSQT